VSELKLALERISTWYSNKKPQSPPVFKRGLSRLEIDELVKDLQLPLPEEVYELYEWCNGSSEETIAFHQYHLLPLEQAVRLRQDKYGLNYGEDWMQDDPSWFPIFELWCDHAFYVVILGDKQKSTIRNYDPEVNNYNIYYENLTNMLLHSAEWLELARYHEKMELWEVDPTIDRQLETKYKVSL
jgi:SMI1 / KNR4 family (SUKH-1)